jgi:ABC-type sulfate transport system permease subunit
VFNCTGLAKNAHLRALSRLLLLLLVVVVVVVVVVVAVEVVVVISFMQDIYNYIPETNHGARAAILWLPLMVQLMLFPMLNVLYFILELP